MITKLAYKKAIKIVKEIPTTGHNPLLILTEDFEQYYTKSSKGEYPTFELISEFLCHYFLRLWEIPTPDIAVVQVNTRVLQNHRLSKNHKPNHFRLPCFGSKLVENVVDANLFFDLQKKRLFQQIFEPQSILKLGLFDIWIENDDRKPTNFNLLFAPFRQQYRPLAIDHAYTFNTLAYQHLNPDYGVSVTYNESILYTELAKNIYDCFEDKALWRKEMQKYFSDCLFQCQRFFKEVAENIPVELGFEQLYRTKVYEFLFSESRNQIVFQEFLSRF